jgi:N6-L-threonylcarbamoyladenine synthase
MSFSGIKTSVRHFLASDAGATNAADVAASFQAAVVDVLIDRVERALARRSYAAIVLSGGVAANGPLQAAFRGVGVAHALPALVPARQYCTDNAAMIAAAADRRGEAARADALSLTADPNLRFDI